ncbi:MAG: uracil-DNA glycosylase [Rikenellaceae bacterium]
MIKELLPEDWRELLRDEFEKPYFVELEEFVAKEYEQQQIFPPQEQIMRAFEWCAVEDVKVVIIGQDPYHDVGQANGLCFSVADGVKFPPSLRNIFKEIVQQYGSTMPESGNLERWARQGVLLMNSVLTVRAHAPESHKKRGWELFTDAVVEALSKKRSGVVYMLWGAYAKAKGEFICDVERNCILEAAHPSPLSFRHREKDVPQFIAANDYLQSQGKELIEWSCKSTLTLF